MYVKVSQSIQNVLFRMIHFFRMMREVEYDPRSGEYDEARKQGLSIRDLRYADDTGLLSTTTAGLQNLIKSVKEHSE